MEISKSINNKYHNKSENKFKIDMKYKGSKSTKNKYLNNIRYDDNLLTKFSNELIDNAINNSEEDIYNRNNKEKKLIMKRSKQINIENNMISDFILKNNIFNGKRNLEDNEDKNVFDQFLKREKMFKKKVDYNKEKIMKSINDEILSKMQTKPNINEKSRRIMSEKKKKVKNLKQNNSSNKNNMKQLIKTENYNSSRNNKNYNIKTFNNDDKNRNIKRKFTYEKRKTNKKLEINITDNETKDIRRNNSENNIKIKKKIKELPLHTSKINNYIKKSESLKFIYMDRIKEKSNYDSIIKYNMISPTIKMKKLEIQKINEELNNLRTKEIDFYSFCKFLFQLGFVNIQHDEKNVMKYNEIDSNDEIVDNLLIHAYFDVNFISKKFIFNEINIIKNAFKSIHEDFNIQNYKNIEEGEEFNIENILSDINYSITINEFKLFIFIMSNLFEGFDIKDTIANGKEKNIKKYHKYADDNKNVIINKENESINNKLYINDIIKKILSIKNIDKFTTDFINNYKTYFNYIIKTHEKYKFLSEVQKKENTKKPKDYNLRNQNEYIFKPKLNNEKATKYFKGNSFNEKENKKENNFYKNQSLNNYKLSQEKLFPFKPQIDSPNLKKIFHKHQSKTNISLKGKPKEFDNIIHNIKINPKAKKDIINKNTLKCNSKDKIDVNHKKTDNKYDITFNPNKNNYKESNKIVNENNSSTNKKIKNKSCNKSNTNKNQKTKIKSVIILQIKNSKKNNNLVIYPNDDYKKVIDDFCLENQMDSNQYMQILGAVRNEINKNYA